jgi:cytochrome c oxidase assembly protein subunit 11
VQEQRLRPGEEIDMPVFFYIDPEYATDPRLRGVDNLTLSYTFFKVAEGEEEEEGAAAPVVAAAAVQAAATGAAGGAVAAAS